MTEEDRKLLDKFDAEKLLADWTEPAGASEISRATTLIMMKESYKQGYIAGIETLGQRVVDRLSDGKGEVVK